MWLREASNTVPFLPTDGDTEEGIEKPKLTSFATVSKSRWDKVEFAVANCTESDQIGFHITALMAAQLLVVDLEIPSGAADLASPAVPLQYLLPQLQVATRI